MARQALTVQRVVPTGVVPSTTAGHTDGHKFPNNGRQWVEVTNGGVGSINVTAQTPATQSGLAVAEQVVAVAAGATKRIGPFDKATYNQVGGTDDGQVYIDLSGTTSVTIAGWTI